MKNILIIGAGPTGLTAALELYRRGFSCRIVDRKEAMSTLSRAVGINPRSLQLLEASGVTERLLREGITMQRADIHDSDSSLMGAMRVESLPRPYNFILALPQDKTERIMHERLKEYGGNVEYRTSLTALRLEGEQAVVTLSYNGAEKEDRFDMVIAADGSRSVVRNALGIAFPGFDYPNQWSLADFESRDIPYPAHHAHLFIRERGNIAVLIAIGEQRFRAVSNTEDALKQVPGNFTINRIINANQFHIGVRQAETYQKGCVYLAGDAAHIHSPAGGRGMNLGIEDAWELVRRMTEGGLAGYTAARHPAGEKVLKLSESLVRAASLKNPLAKQLRRIVMGVATRIPLLQRPFLKRIAGID